MSDDETPYPHFGLSLYYDKDGTPIRDIMALGEKLEDPDYRRVALTHVAGTPDGPDAVWVSTVWTGFASGLSWLLRDGNPRQPLIFESMVFAAGHDFDLDRRLYPTETMALAGHDQLVAEVRAALAPRIDLTP